MRHRSLWYLALLSTTACGSGRLTPAETPEPAPGPVAAPTPAAEPAPATEPPPATPPPSAAPAPEAAPSAAVPVPDPASAGAAGYAPYDAPGAALPIRRIGQWTASGLDSPVRKVIRDDSTYAQFWQALGAGQRPAVDFTRDVVIAVAAGQRPTGGHAIAVERVARAGKSMTVEVVETVPGPGCWTTQQITQPVDVVVVAAADAPTWSFSDRTKSQGCK
jgi:protease stability complex PrcB-like protein